jgi:cytochrome P450
MHYNIDVFLKPDEFVPEGCLTDNAEELARRERHLVAFSIGSRQGIGINLATMELYISNAVIFRCYKA